MNTFPTSFLKSVNSKIILFFMAFVFIPLLVFSFLGYDLNKDMITKLNLSQLRIINNNYAKAIERYISDKNSQPGAFSGDLNEIQDLLKSDIVEYNHSIYLLSQKQKITSEGIEDFSEQDSVFTRIQNGTIEQMENEISKQKSQGVFTASASVDNGKIIVASQLNAHHFFSELTSFRNKILMANLIFATILFLIALFYSRQITRPIHKLIKAVQRIRQGNLDYQIRIETNDEIQILAHEFELLRQKLQDSYQGMEEKIQSRTKELQEAQAQISHQEKMASLGLMAAGIAHEIGNPLTSISSMVQVIKRKNPDAKTIEYVQNILKNIDRISRIVRELVDFSRPASYKKSNTDINEIIKSAVGIIKYDRRSKKIQFVLNLDKIIPNIVLVSDHLLQVFLNILINALDASEGYGDEIKVTSYHLNEHIHIEFSDQGCGIASDKLNKIFEPFYTTKGVGKGTGLGLTVSYGIIKKMGGEIKVKSILEEGSTFTVIIPSNDETEVSL